MENGIPYVLLENVHHHEGQEADLESAEAGEHCAGDADVLPLARQEPRQTLGGRVLVGEDFEGAAADFIKNARIAQDDRHSGHEESQREQELFGGPTVVPSEDGAREGDLLVSEVTPLTCKSGHQDGVAEGPAEGDH